MTSRDGLYRLLLALLLLALLVASWRMFVAAVTVIGVVYGVARVRRRA